MNTTPEQSKLAAKAREKERADQLTDGFLGERTTKVAGYDVNPFTFGSMSLCRKLKLTLFTKEGASDELSEDEVMRQLAAFFWIQTNEPEYLLDAVYGGAAEKAIDKFGFNLPLHELPNLMRRINELAELAGAAAVDIEAKPGEEEDNAPKNS